MMIISSLVLAMSSAGAPDCADHVSASKQPEANRCMTGPMDNNIYREVMMCSGKLEATQRLGKAIIPLTTEPTRGQYQGLFNQLEPYNQQFAGFRKIDRLDMDTSGGAKAFAAGQAVVAPSFELEPQQQVLAYAKHASLTDRCVDVLSFYVGNMTAYQNRAASE